MSRAPTGSRTRRLDHDDDALPVASVRSSARTTPSGVTMLAEPGPCGRPGDSDGYRAQNVSAEPQPITIRDAAPGDAAAIAPLLGQLGYPTGPEAFARRFERLAREPATWIFVAERSGRVVGLAGLRVMALVERDEPVGRLIALVVAEDLRGAGIGRMLVDHVEERARRQGCVELDLTSSDRRNGAHAFYRRLGFADVSRRFVKAISPRDG
jgi:GNAT superfamily N-acetyltransferase